jgi:hypothetical protein
VDAPVLSKYKGYDIVMINNDVAIYNSKEETLEFVALDDTKSNSDKRFNIEGANNLETAKKQIDLALQMEERKKNTKTINLTTETKTTENAIQEPSPTQEVPRTREGGQNIPEGGQGVRPSEQGKETAQQGEEEVKAESVGGDAGTSLRGVKYSDIIVGDKYLEDILSDNKLSEEEKKQVREVFARGVDYFKFDKEGEQKFQQKFANPEDITDIADIIEGISLAKEAEFNFYNTKNYENVKDAVNYIANNPNEYSPKVVKAVKEIKEKLDNPSSSMSRLYAIDVMKELGITEQPLKETAQKGKEEVNPALKDIESTAKALEGMTFGNIIETVPYVSGIDRSNPIDLATTYHLSKKDGSNPELVKAVEELLTTKTIQDEKTEKGPMLEGLQATGDEGKGGQAGAELRTEAKGKKEIEELAEPIVIFKGNTGKLNPDGSRRTAHPNIKGVFGSTDLKSAERYGNDISKFDIPKGTTVETVEIKNKKIPLSEARKQETELVNASDAQIVRLITYDAKGREVQYIIKDKSILQQNKPIKNAEEVLTTKQQIENFGVAPEMVEPVNGVISQVFESLKKAGLTAAKNVGEWIGIGKGTQQQDALKKAEIIKLDNGVIKQNKIRGKLLNESQSKDLQAEIESKYDKPDRVYFGYESDDIRKAMFTYYDPMLTRTINGIDIRVAYGLLRKNENGKNERTYLIYADGKVAGEFYSLNDIKKVLDFVESNLVKSLNKEQISQPLFKKGESKKDFGGFETRDGKPIGFTYDTDKVARERFDFSKLKKIGSGSDRDVYDLGNGKVVKVAKTARGLTQNIYEGDYYLKGIIPEVFERGLNYVVAESTPRIKTSDVVQTFDVDGNSIGTATAGEMLKDLQKFSQKNMDNQDSKLQDVLAKYGLQDVMSYNVLWGDFIAQRNWGYKDGVAYHSDGGTFGGVDMITSFKGKANLSDPEFREIYQESKKLKKQFGDTDKATMYKEQGGDVQAQYRIESGKNTIEAIKSFDGSPEAVVALTHEIMHPTVVAIIDGAAEGNEVGTRHTQTIVDEFNKANPKSKVTVVELIAGNNAFREGTTSEQYRDVQEFIAESWEKYHTEGGKGFSEAFQKVLEQITEAFRAVYKTLSGKQITPELRQMFDEILGKEATTVSQPTLSDFGLTYKNVNDKFNEVSKIMPYRALETALENLEVERGDLDSAKEAFLAEFISKDLPSKLPNKKDKFDKDDLPKGEVVVKPIIKKITPSNPSNTKTKIDSLKNIVGNDDMRPVMNGVFQDAENGMLAATDAFKLITVSDATITESKIVDPKTGQTIQGRFPNYLAIIPQNNPIQVDVNVQDLINQTAGISRASDFFVGKNEFAIAVRIKIGDNNFYFNPKLLNDVLTVFANYGAKDVTFKLSTPTRAMVIEYGGVTGLLMPVMGENNQGNVLPHVTVVNRELTNKEKADGIKADLEYLSKKLEDKKKKLSDAKNNVRNASSNKDLNSANFDVKYEEKAVAEAQLEYDNKKAELDNLDNPLQEQFDLETVKTAIENGEITEQEATEFIESTIENTTEVESVIATIESKAESENEVELNEVIQNADKLISSQEGTQVGTDAFADLAKKSGAAKVFSLGGKNIFYHASPKKRKGRLEKNNAPQFGTGIYFSTNKDLVVEEFGDNVTEVELSITNPVYTKGEKWRKVKEEAIKEADKEYGEKNGLTLDEGETYFRYNPDILSEIDEIPSYHISDAAIKLGYDAIIDEGSSMYENEVIVLDENKIIYEEDKTDTFADLANQFGEAAKEAVKPETPTAQTFADISQNGKAGRDARESARKKFGKDAVAKMEEISRNFDKLIEQLESENKVRKECP